MNPFASFKAIPPRLGLASVASVALALLAACAGEPAQEDAQSAPGQALVIKIGLGEPPPCTPTADVDPSRSLIVTDAAILARFPLKAVFDKLISLANVASPDALGLYRRWWDSQNTSATGVFPDAIHCDDELDANGVPAINGFPIQCPRNEGLLALSDPFLDLPTNLAFMKPVALVNRFDLTPADGSHCGEYRIIYAKRSGETIPLDRNIFILEAQLPNPNPSCGLAACLPIAKLWASLTSVSDVNARADALESFYFDGLPGFPPVLHPTNLSEGAGQIRTNQFMPGINQRVWQLREFQLARLCDGPGGACRLLVKPVSVKGNPFGPLFNASSTDSRAASFQAHFLSQVEALAPQDVTALSMVTPSLFNAGQSNSEGTENDYAVQLSQGGANNPFEQAINAKLASIARSDLTAANIAARATTQSCGGCHELSSGDQLGGMQWPAFGAANTFVYVTEKGQLSGPLTQVFLPHRKQVLLDYLTEHECGTCDDDPGAGAKPPHNAQKASDDNTSEVPTLGGSRTH